LVKDNDVDITCYPTACDSSCWNVVMSDLQAVLAELQQALELGLPVAHASRRLLPLLQAEVDVWDEEVKAISRAICDEIFGKPDVETDDDQPS